MQCIVTGLVCLEQGLVETVRDQAHSDGEACTDADARDRVAHLVAQGRCGMDEFKSVRFRQSASPDGSVIAKIGVGGNTVGATVTSVQEDAELSVWEKLKVIGGDVHALVRQEGGWLALLGLIFVTFMLLGLLAKWIGVNLAALPGDGGVR